MSTGEANSHVGKFARRAFAVNLVEVAPFDRTAAARRASCGAGGVHRRRALSLVALTFAAFGCGLETSGFVLRPAPESDASFPPEVGPVDAVAEEACATCPRVIIFGNEVNTPQPGGDGGTIRSNFLDICPEGQVVIGYAGSLNPSTFMVDGTAVTVIGSLQTLCGHISITDASATIATIVPGDTLASRPDAAISWRTTCPDNKAIVGFTGASGIAFDKVAFQCTALQITKGPSGDLISPDTSTIQTLMANGGDAGSNIYAEVCPDGKIGQGSNIRTGSNFVEAFGLVCATPSIVAGDAGAACCTLPIRQTYSRTTGTPPHP
jgi:hypothetical protein